MLHVFIVLKVEGVVFLGERNYGDKISVGIRIVVFIFMEPFVTDFMEIYQKEVTSIPVLIQILIDLNGRIYIETFPKIVRKKIYVDFEKN